MDIEAQDILLKFNRLDDEGKHLVMGFLTGYLAMMERGGATRDTAPAKTDYG